jgi:DNA-binding beta-propeller fold protein YncE
MKVITVILGISVAIVFLLTPVVTASESYEFVTQWGSYGNGNGQFNSPQGIAVDSSGFIYVSDSGNYRIQKFTSSGDYVSTLTHCSQGRGWFLNLPEFIAVDSSDAVFVTDYIGRSMLKFQNGNCVDAWDFFSMNKSLYDYPTGLAIDHRFVYVAIDRQIYKFEKSGSENPFVKKWGSLGNGTGQFILPQGLAVDKSGNVYVVDSIVNRVQKFDPNGNYLLQWGINGSFYSQFKKPTAIAIDSADHVFIADTENNRIQKFSSNGTFITAWGTVGKGVGQFQNPDGIALDANGFVYVADRYNSRIQKFFLKATSGSSDKIITLIPTASEPSKPPAIILTFTPVEPSSNQSMAVTAPQKSSFTVFPEIFIAGMVAAVLLLAHNRKYLP